MAIDKKLTDLTEITEVPNDAWIHVVDPSDISQSPEGSSYKAKKESFFTTATDTTASHNKGNYNITTNSPTLVDGTGQIGDYYALTTTGSRDFGSGSLSFSIGDRIEYNGTIWFKAVNNSQEPTETSFGTFSSGLTTEDTLADGDLFNYTDISDSNKQKKTTWSNIKSLLTTVFNALYVPLARTITIAGVSYDLSANRTWLPESEILSWFTGDQYSVQSTGGALSLYGIATPTTVGTGSNVQANFAGTYTSAPLNFSNHRSSVSSSSAGNSAEFYENTQKHVANELGFVFHGKTGFTWQSGTAAYTGLTGSNAATGNSNPSSLTDLICFGADDSDSNLHFMHNDSSGVADKIDMGSNFALQSINAYSYIIWNVFGSNTVNIQIRNLRNNMTFSTSVNTNLPSINTGLTMHSWVGNRAVAVAVTNKFTYYSLQRQS